MSDRAPSIHTLAALMAVLALAAGPAAAQYPPTYPGQPQPTFSDEVIVTATGVETAVDEAPTAVTVITRDEIDDVQSGSVADLLRRVPGLSVVASGDAGKVTSVFTRGTASNQTLVMLDGVRLNSPYFGAVLHPQPPLLWQIHPNHYWKSSSLNPSSEKWMATAMNCTKFYATSLPKN